MAQQLVGIVHKTLFQMFIDMWKAYDYLDRRRFMYIIRGYGLGPNIQRLLQR